MKLDLDVWNALVIQYEFFRCCHTEYRGGIIEQLKWALNQEKNLKIN